MCVSARATGDSHPCGRQSAVAQRDRVIHRPSQERSGGLKGLSCPAAPSADRHPCPHTTSPDEQNDATRMLCTKSCVVTGQSSPPTQQFCHLTNIAVTAPIPKSSNVASSLGGWWVNSNAVAEPSSVERDYWLACTQPPLYNVTYMRSHFTQ